MTVNEAFRRFAERCSKILGTPWVFASAVSLVVGWALCGPVFSFSENWQLVINTGTTIITFLMVFLVQNTQNRDSTAIHLKLDELLRAMKGARNGLINLDKLSEDDLVQLRAEFDRIGKNEDGAAGDIGGHLREALSKNVGSSDKSHG